MAVYNPPQQVLFSPVTNYYQGKAMRQQLAAGEQDREFKDLQMDVAREELAAAPSKREAAKQKALLDAKNIQSQISVRMAGEERDSLIYADEVMKPLFEAYNNAPEDEAEEVFNTGLPEALSRLPKEMQQNFRGMDTDGDKYFNHDEIMRAGLARRTVEDIAKADHSARYQQAIDGGLEPGTPEFNEYVLNKGGEGAGRQRDDEIRDATKILSDMGVPSPEIEAIKQVDGLVVYTVSPSDGALYRTDKLTGKTEEVEIAPPGGERPEPDIPYEETLYALTEEATGIGPGAKEFLSKALGPIGGYTDERTIEAKSKFKAAENTLIRAFSLNPRYPVAEQNRIKENIQIKPKFWDSPDLMRSRMAGVREFLEFERDNALWLASRPGVDRKTRATENQTADAANIYLKQLGNPKDAPKGAIDLLMSDPSDAAKEEFKKMFGYLPDNV